MIETIWIVPLLPLLGVLINTFFGRYLPGKTAAWLAAALVGVGAAYTLATIFQTGIGAEFEGQTVKLYDWITVGSFSVNFGLWLDPLSLLMTMIITGVGFLIHMYSIGYMAHDEGIRRYFIYLNLFIFAMLMLVLGDNYLLMFLGWEGVGLCSYLLISFWYADPNNAAAGKKAFIVNRIGDFAVLLAIFLTWTVFGTLQYSQILAEGTASALTAVTIGGVGVMTVITLLFFIGCTGKSAQIPLFVWLPDAMAGPTPVSALIHAATMVTAGVYLLARSAPLMELAPFTQDVVAWIGVLTAFFAATIALTQTDIKRVLAYSTVSQLGFMFLGIGAGAYVAAIFHLLTHAFFKALLFLGAGAVMHAMEHGLHHVRGHGHGAHDDHAVLHAGAAPAAHEEHDVVHAGITPAAPHDALAPHMAEVHGDAPAEADVGDEGPNQSFDVQDMRNMGGLWSRAPITAWTFLIGALALAGFPFTSGWFSKDEILTLTQHDGRNLLWIIGLVTAFMTAFYTFRQFFMVFGGKPRSEPAEHAAENPLVMTIPLMVLAAFALLAGIVLGWPIEDGIIHHALHGWHIEMEHVGWEISTTMALLLSSVIAIAGIALAWALYGGGRMRAPNLGPLYRGSLNKWYVDEIYNALIVRPFEWLATWSARFFDRLVIDGAVNGTGSLFALLNRGLSRVQSGFVRGYAMSIVVGLLLVALYLVWRVSAAFAQVPQ